MKARDVMSSPVITVRPDATVKDVAKTFLEHGISGAPVVDQKGNLVGMVSEGDLLYRTELDTERRRSGLARFFAGSQMQAADYIKSHAKRVSDVMTRHVISAAPDAPLETIATLMEKHSINRVPVVLEERVVGIVSRGNLVEAIASYGPLPEIPLADLAIRDALLEHLRKQPWAQLRRLNVTVHDGVVGLWGHCYSNEEREAVRIAAENIPGVRAVNNNLAFVPTNTVY